MHKQTKTFLHGAKMGIPIGLGYFAVSLSLGIAAKNAGLTGFQAAITSLLLNASAGEYAAFTLMALDASYLEIAVMEFIANARYLLMSCVLSTKLKPETKLRHKLLMAVAVTDEMFGVSVAQKDKISPIFYFGMMAVAMPGWCSGTFLGVLLGNVLPPSVVSALSVSLYGMFLAIIIPNAKKDRIILLLIIVSFVLSFLASIVPLISSISEGTRTTILTVAISSLAAVLFPIKDESEGTQNAT